MRVDPSTSAARSGLNCGLTAPSASTRDTARGHDTAAGGENGSLPGVTLVGRVARADPVFLTAPLMRGTSVDHAERPRDLDRDDAGIAVEVGQGRGLRGPGEDGVGD